MELELTKAQQKAVKSLERALKKCADSNMYIHNCYGHLIAYDAAVVRHVDDDETDISCDDGEHITVPTELELSSWADDAHYVHLQDE